MHVLRFDAVKLPADAAAFRKEIREFLARELPHVPAQRRANCWAVFDAEFSRKLGARGWIGMVCPKQYGGHERSALPDGRWRINGQKIWTSNAQHSQLMIALVRTGSLDEKNRHAGLSQFLLELRTPGIRIQPIVDLVGQAGFNEVFFDDVVVEAHCLLGAEGDGWRQVTSELSLERSGPELPLQLRAVPRARAPRRPCRLRGAAPCNRPAHRRVVDVATDVALGRRPARGRR